MEKFIAATPRPWKHNFLYSFIESNDDSKSICEMSVNPQNEDFSYEEYKQNSELIVTAVNNFDKMKDAIETQLQIIEALIGSKRIVNLDESIAYYKQLLESLK